MKPSVYIETTVVGHLTSRLPSDLRVASQMLDTRKWWNESRNAFDVFTSQLVRDESARGDAQAAAERLEAIRLIPNVPITDAASVLAKALVKQRALPEKARVDALHVSICATSGIKYLLTWNCRHLANATLRAKIEEVCKQHGYNAPTVCTPTELTEVGL